jgi:hypothetical protein
MKIAKINIKWDFSNTEFENVQYKKAIKICELPEIITIPFFDKLKDNIEDYIHSQYGFSPKKYSIVFNDN